MIQLILTMNRKSLCLFCLTFFVGTSTLWSQQGPGFTYKSDSLGLWQIYGDPADYGGGISWVDFNGDGWDDFSFGSADGEPLYIYKNTGGGLVPMSTAVFGDSGHARSLTWADYDNDGDKDLFVSHEYESNRLYRNEGNWNFTEVTQTAGIDTTATYAYSACWGDYDRDGWLDL